MKSSTETIIGALRILAAEIQSGDGVANAAIGEVADRMEELARAVDVHPVRIAALDARIVELNADLDAHEKLLAEKNLEIDGAHQITPEQVQQMQSAPQAKMNTDQAREFLVMWMHANFPTDKTFSTYINEQLAGDFAWQLATALATAPNSSIPAPKIDTSPGSVEAVKVSIGDDHQFQEFIGGLVNAEYENYMEYIAKFVAYIDSRAAPIAPPAAAEQWISVEDRLPAPDTDVLVRCLRGMSVSCDVAGTFDGFWMSCATEGNTKGIVTHWMPLPAAPAGKQGGA